MELIIRQAKFNDIEAIAEIKVTGWQSAYKGIIDDKYLASMSVTEQNKVIKNYSFDTIFVVENGNEILGFCRFYDYDRPVYDDKEIDCEIREIYVKPDMKRMGIGSNLFAHTMNYFAQKGKRKLYLGVFKDNHNARKFYEKMGGIAQAEGSMEIGGKCYPTVSYVYNLNDIKIEEEQIMDAQELYELAMKHIYGDGVPENNDLATELLIRAHEMGHVEATYNLGICYHYGFGTDVDLAKAFELYLEAANAGYGKGMNLVGRFYNRGIYVKRDRKQAEYWLLKSMESSEPEVVDFAKNELIVE